MYLFIFSPRSVPEEVKVDVDFFLRLLATLIGLVPLQLWESPVDYVLVLFRKMVRLIDDVPRRCRSIDLVIRPSFA